MKKYVLSISLGSSSRNKKAEIRLGDEVIVVERIGTDGDTKKARDLYLEMDGKVDVFGMGGALLSISAGEKSFPFRAGTSLVKDVTKTPVADGSGIKHTLERNVMQVIEPLLDAPFEPKKALVVVGIDRFDIALSLNDGGYDVIFGDLMFTLGIPILINNFNTALKLARLLLPVLSKLPVSMLYPTGKSQERINSKYAKWLRTYPVVAGDFLFIRKHLPDELTSQMIVTNTTTEDDVVLLKQRGLKYLVTTTPVFKGRSFGTNVIEAILVAYAGKERLLSATELSELLEKFAIKPALRKLNDQ